MATDALTAFLARDFARAEAELSALSDDDPDDPRIRHNLLVTRLYARAAPEDVDALVAFVGGHLPRPAPTKAAFFAEARADPPALRPLYARVGPVALYNCAVVAYAEGAARAAAALGAALYANVEAMDDCLALRTCFLLVDIHLRLGDPAHAAAVAAYADRLLPAFAPPAPAPAPAPADPPAPAPAPSEIRPLAPESPARGRAVLDAPASYEDAKFCMHIYNARISAVCEGARNIRKEAKSAVVAADDPESRPTAAALLVKARVEQNLAKSLRILASIGTHSPPHVMKKVRPLTLNSLGILHHRLGRHSVAACYFEHARRAFVDLFDDDKPNGDSSASGGERVNLTVLTSVTDSHVSYNLGLQNMKLGDYSRALELFSTAARADTILANSSPLLWIRMAECCVGLESSGANGRLSLAVEGNGRGRRLIMRSEDRSEGLGMEYASTCARGALAILDTMQEEEQDNGSSDAQKGRTYTGVQGNNLRQGKSLSNETRSSQPNSRSQLLRGAALCILAYSSLSFDPHAAIEACNELIKLYPHADNERGILGRLYSAEALCLLRRADEAANRLAPLLAMNASATSNFKEAACINMALSHVSNNDIPAASRAAKVALKVAAQKGYSGLQKQASFVGAYVFLRSGETETARQVLRALQMSM